MFTPILIGLTIPLIAAARRQTWTANMMPVIVLGALVVAYVGGQYLDGVPPSFTIDYLRGFAIALGAQQGIHRMVKGMPWFQAVEAVGEIAPAPDRVAP